MGKSRFKSLVFLMLVSVLLISMQPINSQAKTKVSAPKAVRIWRHTDSAVRLKWGKVKKADGYIVYKYDKSTKKYKKYKTINSKKTCFLIDEVGEGKIGRYKIRSFKKMGGKKVLSQFSHAVWARAYTKMDKKVNVGKTELMHVDEEKAEADWIELAYHESAEITAKINPSKYSKAKKKKVISNKLRWYSTDNRIATVDQKGGITAKGKEGVCTVYTRAHNGKKSNEILVRVENYAKPDKDSLELDEAYEASNVYKMTLELFVNHYKTTTDIAEYFYQNRNVARKSFFCWMEDGELKIRNEAQMPDDIKRVIANFIKAFSYDIRIAVSAGTVKFSRITENDDLELIVFSFDGTYQPNKMVYMPYKLTDNWFYGMYADM